MPNFQAITQRNARSVQTTVGWIFWDPGAIARYIQLGLPEELASGLGYIAARSAPLAPVGRHAVIAVFGSISPLGIAAVFDHYQADHIKMFWTARDKAIIEGLARYAPTILPALEDFGPELWEVVEQLPLVGRVYFGALLELPRPSDPVLSGWHAVNALREWRGDTHWALVIAEGLDHAEASILHNSWLDYEADWLALSRGTSPQDIADAWESLEGRGLAKDHLVSEEGMLLRQKLEDETDRATIRPWELLGEKRSIEFAERFEAPCELLLRRVDETAGPNYQPASRLRPNRTS